jgi:hypothetical protein
VVLRIYERGRKATIGTLNLIHLIKMGRNRSLVRLGGLLRRYASQESAAPSSIGNAMGNVTGASSKRMFSTSSLRPLQYAGTCDRF